MLTLTIRFGRTRRGTSEVKVEENVFVETTIYFG